MKIQKVIHNKIIYSAKFNVAEIEKALVEKIAKEENISLSADTTSVQMTRMPEGDITIEITVDHAKAPMAAPKIIPVELPQGPLTVPAQTQCKEEIFDGTAIRRCVYIAGHQGKCNHQ
jgi:hypothetical protein